MKVFSNILVILILLFLLSCTTIDYPNIQGEWIAEGYNCKNSTGLSEEISISRTGETFFAIKLTGDDCIPAGDTTWYGKLEGDEIVGKIKGINPSTNELEWIECEVRENIGFLFLSVEDYQVLKMRRK